MQSGHHISLTCLVRRYVACAECLCLLNHANPGFPHRGRLCLQCSLLLSGCQASGLAISSVEQKASSEALATTVAMEAAACLGAAWTRARAYVMKYSPR